MFCFPVLRGFVIMGKIRISLVLGNGIQTTNQNKRPEILQQGKNFLQLHFSVPGRKAAKRSFEGCLDDEPLLQGKVPADKLLSDRILEILM